MALSLDITLSASSADSTATITDSTVYGSPNPTRNSLAVYLELWKMDSKGIETVVNLTYTPATVTSWTFSYTLDGHYLARHYAIPVWDNTVVYLLDQVVYYSGNLYKATQTTLAGTLPTNTSYFSLITLSSVGTASNVTSTYHDFVLVEYGKKCAGAATITWFDKQDCGDCDKIELKDKMLQLRSMVIAVQTLEALSQYSKAEEICRRIEIMCESC